MDFRSALEAIVSEVGDVESRVSAEEAGRLADLVRAAERLFLAGQGRSGLVARAFAMRLSQMGFDVYVVGETTAPAIGSGDTLVAVSGSGQTPVTCHFAEVARSEGAVLAAVTADGASRLAREADVAFVVEGKVKTGAGRPSVQMPGSLFEQAAFIALDAVSMVLQETLGKNHDSLRQRHANLE